MQETIRKRIIETVQVADNDQFPYCNIMEYKNLVHDNIWTKAIQTALDEKKCVYIPDMGHEILLDGTVFMDSDTHLKVADQQVIRLLPQRNVCMLRNRNMIPGGHAYVELQNPDERITVTGGIWMAPENTSLRMDKMHTIVGGFALMAFSNVRFVNVTNVTFARSLSYALMMSNCENFYIDSIRFDRFDKDGIHIDGPAKMGIIQNLDGIGLGDDMVALLAWDWYTSGVTNGDIEDILVRNIKGDNNEIRLLSGRKVYYNGKKKDCNLRRCVFENITGIYTYKMYYQPNCVNVPVGKYFDSAETVGRMDDIYFDSITIPKIRETGFNDIPIYGIFDILADCKNLNIKNVQVEPSWEELEQQNIRLVNAGPISATYRYTDNKEKWGDFFEPDMCCTVEDLHFKQISFAGQAISDPDKLVKETQQTVNPDYPNTLPEGGTGFGTIQKITLEP